MAMLGPISQALDALKGEIETGNSGQTVSHTTGEASEKTTTTKGGLITHHYKMSETHIKEGEYQESNVVQNDDSIEQTNAETSNKRCKCFSFLRICKRK